MLLASALDIGGAERVIANLARCLDRHMFTPTVCHLMDGGPVGDELIRDGYDVVGVNRSSGRFERYLSSRALRRLVVSRDIDLIHSHTHYALTDACLCSLSMGRRVKVVHTFHFGNYPHVPRRYQLLEGIGARMVDRLVAVGTEQAKRIGATYRLAPDRIDVVTNGVNVGAPSIDPEWCARIRRTHSVVVGTIATFIEQKGLPDLLRVAAEVCQRSADVLFVVVGDGPLRPAIEQQCRQLNLSERVLFTGSKPDAARTMLPLFDIFFQPSLWEAMSVVVLEAMAAALPVVATDVGDNRHVVVHGRTGFIVPRADVAAMAAMLARLVASPELRRTLGGRGQRRYAERYTVSHMTRNYERLYLDVLS
jgi:glycosyltransferase involved in cell wall biosynthesis